MESKAALLCQSSYQAVMFVHDLKFFCADLGSHLSLLIYNLLVLFYWSNDAKLGNGVSVNIRI